ncbi:hypothetical protein ACFL21_04075 [Patescibacteria group bacterium]
MDRRLEVDENSELESSSPEPINEEILSNRALKEMFCTLFKAYMAKLDFENESCEGIIEEAKEVVKSFTEREGGNLVLKGYSFMGIIDGEERDNWELLYEINIENKVLRIFIAKEEFSSEEWPIVLSLEKMFECGSGLYSIVDSD